MKVSENYTYELPESKIAARPIRPYDSAKLLVIDRENGVLKEDTFRGLDSYLSDNDVLIINNTKVNRCRLFGKIENSGKEAEFLLIKEMDTGIFECLARPVKNLKNGTRVLINEELTALILERLSDQTLKVKFEGENVGKAVAAAGVMPIPPYIRGGRADSEDLTDYQTMFAEHSGSVAAPTASLHFTKELLEKIRSKGTMIRQLTLHIGMSSIRPIREGSENPGEETYLYDRNLLNEVKKDKAAGKRIIAVGTSAVRALESMFSEDLETNVQLSTDLFITPGYEFKAVDALITNFHFPASTHLLLVEALLGRGLLEKAYQYALVNNFRFLSYGDGMLIK